MMSKQEYICGYKYCLHNGEKVSASEAVKIGNKYYHWDCAALKQDIQKCVEAYMNCIEDQTQFPIVYRIINTLVFKHEVPTDFILKKINASKSYYSDRPVKVLYGLRKLYWEYQ